jgi:hypothetical protein
VNATLPTVFGMQCHVHYLSAGRRRLGGEYRHSRAYQLPHRVRDMARQTGAGIEAREVAAKPINVGGGGAAAQPDADGGTACLACIARTGAPRGAAPPHSVTIQAWSYVHKS